MNIDLLDAGAPPGLNVLVIAYYFPPMGLSGVQRTLKFVKYLPEFGWRPIVLTPAETPYYAHDTSLLDEIEPLIEKNYIRIVRTPESGAPGFKVSRVEGRGLRVEGKEGDRIEGNRTEGNSTVFEGPSSSLYPNHSTLYPRNSTLKLPSAKMQRLRSKVLQTIFQPDSRIRWKKPALAMAEKIFREERIDAILATAPPFTSFLIAQELSKKFHVPYLMDYRDAWVGNSVLNFYATPFHKAYAHRLEDRALRGSTAITVASRPMKEVLVRQYPFIGHEDVMILSHGFDPEDLERASLLAENYRDPEKFRLTYGGTFYVGRSPLPIFRALEQAFRAEPDLKRDLELVFAGILQKEYSRAAEKMGLGANIRATGYLPHLEDLALLLASDVLWMTMSDTISAPGKLYEYLGTHKPILGLVPPRSQAEKILKDYGAGITVAPDDIPAISEAILDLYRRWKKTLLPHNVNLPFVQSFDRKRLTHELARQLGLMLRP